MLFICECAQIQLGLDNSSSFNFFLVWNKTTKRDFILIGYFRETILNSVSLRNYMNNFMK
jgi:hypothetical protein